MSCCCSSGYMRISFCKFLGEPSIIRLSSPFSPFKFVEYFLVLQLTDRFQLHPRACRFPLQQTKVGRQFLYAPSGSPAWLISLALFLLWGIWHSCCPVRSSTKLLYRSSWTRSSSFTRARSFNEVSHSKAARILQNSGLLRSSSGKCLLRSGSRPALKSENLNLA